jgi:hypothetical protein
MAGPVPAICARTVGADSRNRPGYDGETKAHVPSHRENVLTVVRGERLPEAEVCCLPSVTRGIRSLRETCSDTLKRAKNKLREAIRDVIVAGLVHRFHETERIKGEARNGRLGWISIGPPPDGTGQNQTFTSRASSIAPRPRLLLSDTVA